MQGFVCASKMCVEEVREKGVTLKKEKGKRRESAGMCTFLPIRPTLLSLGEIGERE